MLFRFHVFNLNFGFCFRTNIAAICADDVKVKIIDCEQDHAVIMEDNLHVDFVRSLAWNRNELLSCSWDNTVQKRSLPST